MRGDTLVTNGGRILSVTATGTSVTEARGLAYAAVTEIDFEGARFRTDIGAPTTSIEVR
jgi:phosphoribosylamine--glycine ligase